MNYREINRNKIIDYIKSGEKEADDLSIGLEFEHIMVHKESFKSVHYEEGVEKVLEQLLLKGWRRMDGEPRLVNLYKNKDSITLEPGAQLELSIYKCKTVKEMEDRYLSFAKEILPILDAENYCLLAIGYRPADSIAQIPMIPKERYKYMAEYLSQKGTHALHMMKGSASLQLSVDYTDQDDYIKKNRVANYLSPATSYLFDNSPLFEEKVHKGNAARVQIWNNMDDDRSRLIPGVLDKEFGYEDYVDYILERPCIIGLIDDKLVFTKDKPAKEVYEGVEMNKAQIEHLISMYFPDVRTKKYIEIRMSDSVPWPYNLAASALWKGILYSSENLDYFYQKSLNSTTSEIEELKNKLIINDSKAVDKIEEMVEDMLTKATEVATTDDKKYMDSLAQLFNEHRNLSNYSKKKLKEGSSLSEALAVDVLSLDDLR